MSEIDDIKCSGKCFNKPEKGVNKFVKTGKCEEKCQLQKCKCCNGEFPEWFLNDNHGYCFVCDSSWKCNTNKCCHYQREDDDDDSCDDDKYILDIDDITLAEMKRKYTAYRNW